MKKIGANINKWEGRGESNKKKNLTSLLYHLIGEDSGGVCTLRMTGHSKWEGALDLCGPKGREYSRCYWIEGGYV